MRIITLIFVIFPFMADDELTDLKKMAGMQSII